MNLRVAMSGEVKGLRVPLAAVKASLNRALKSDGADAKPSDLRMARLKSR